MAGYQCPRRLWQEIHCPERAEKYGPGTEFTFFQGHEVGALARQWRGEGVLIELDRRDVDKAVHETREALKAGASRIYEAAFEHEGFLALADVIERKSDGSWRLIEVKATTRAKDVHVPDLAFQTWLMDRNGLYVSETAVIHLDNQAVWPNDDLLKLTDNSAEVLSAVGSTSALATELKHVAVGEAEPDVEPGRHCSTPYPCPFKKNCWRNVPEDHVGVLPHLSPTKAVVLDARGWKRVSEIQDGSMLSGTQQKWVEAIQTGKPVVDERSIRRWLSGLGENYYSLDFETIAYAVPRWHGVRPYQQIPFQFSCHKQGPSDAPEQTGYLHRDTADPRNDLADALIGALPGTEPVITWNMGFEKRVIGELAEFLPQKRDALLNIQSRLVDLMPVFKSWYLHPKSLGSASIKMVGKAVLGADGSYEDMSVSGGDEAYVAWHKLIFEGAESQLADALEEYCAQDTLLPIKLVKFLQARFP